MSVGNPYLKSVHHKSDLPGGMVASLAAGYGRRIGRRNGYLVQAKYALWDNNAADRRKFILEARDWHRMAMTQLLELRALCNRRSVVES